MGIGVLRRLGDRDPHQFVHRSYRVLLFVIVASSALVFTTAGHRQRKVSFQSSKFGVRLRRCYQIESRIESNVS
jgi:hypothetical protein